MHISRPHSAVLSSLARTTVVVVLALSLSSSALAADDDKPVPLRPGLPPVGPGGAPGPVRPVPALPAGPRAAPDDGSEDGSDDGGSSPSGDGGRRPSTAPSSSSKAPSGAPASSARPATAEDDGGKPPLIAGATLLDIDTASIQIKDLVTMMAKITGKNLIIDPKELKGEVMIISHKKVSPGTAYQAYLSALEVAGYTVATSGSTIKVVKSSGSEKTNIPLRTSTEGIPWSDQFITQLIPLESVAVDEVKSIATSLASKNANVISYATTNTLIITDFAYNVRKIFNLLTELDVASPKSRLEIIQVKFAEASEIQQLIEQVYGTAATSSSSTPTPSDPRAAARARARARRNQPEPEADTEAVSAGSQAKYIDKVIADERTNKLIVRANDEGINAVYELLAEVDVDTDPERQAQIHVVNLEHAKAEEVMDVLSRLSGNTSASNARPTTAAARNAAARTAAARGAPPNAAEDSKTPGVLAAFDSGMRIAHDEATNALVIIAPPDDFRVVKKVIDQLDQRRRQVFVDAVILELSSDDEFEFGIGAHGPAGIGGDNALGIVSGQFAGSGITSLGLSQELLSGLALGVFGQGVDVPFGDFGTISVPAFGIVLHAVKQNSGVNIVSNPNLLTLDNTEAKIVVGRKVPFPSNTTFNNLTGSPVTSYTREDVAITLELTPRINSGNEVTLDVHVEVSEVEEDSSGLDPATAGFITSKREVDTSALVSDNQTVVLGGLVGNTDTEVETKVPILGDLPLIGALFRGKRTKSRKSNLLIFLTPHIVDGPEDMVEIQKIKEAQFLEFRRRFYGKSKEQQMEEMRKLLSYSMNNVDEPSRYRTKPVKSNVMIIDGEVVSDTTREGVREALGEPAPTEPGAGAGEPPTDAPDDLAVPVEPGGEE